MLDDDKYVQLFASIAEVKAHRDAFVAELNTGSVSLAEVFSRAADDPVLSKMKVLPAIEALPETGKVSTRRAFADLGIDEAALISDVPVASIDALPSAIASHAL